jgi:hypothetical protein
VLPTTLAAIALCDDNWLVHHVGADLPADELIRFCDVTRTSKSSR